MARSHTIWLVFRRGHPDPIGCFTVKHECATWMVKQDWWEEELDIYKAPDGGGKAVLYMSSTDFYNLFEWE